MEAIQLYTETLWEEQSPAVIDLAGERVVEAAIHIPGIWLATSSPDERE